jgi:DNA-directed RNA polymerase subunit RPC12/RpoP
MPRTRRSKSAEPLDIVEVAPEEVVLVEPKSPPPGRKFPCSRCGARLDFDPSSQALKCPYCGHAEEIAPATRTIEEHDYKEYLHRLAGKQTVIEGRSSQVRCTGCGAVVLLEDKLATDRCPFCATHLESQPAAAEGMIPPEGVLPCTVADREAREAFNRWIESRWFAPTELRQLANLGQLQGVYLPFWTYDSMTYTHYTGERGDDYQVTETYTDTEWYTETTTDANGQATTVSRSRPVVRTRTVTKTRWTHVAGNVQHFFDDVLICASNSLQDREVGRLGPWDLKNLEEFQPHFLSGFKTERYAVGLEDGFARAREVMDGHIRQLCCRDIGGNHQRLHNVRTQHVGVTFKHLLMPVWLGAYRYRDQPYRVIVNARTGRVFGSRPYSVAKIVMLILAILLFIGMLIGTVALVGGLAAR